MVTDRPDQTESPSVVLPGWVQIETGILWETEEVREGTLRSRTRRLQYPAALARIGLIDPLELRLTGQFETENTTSNGKKTASRESILTGFGGKFRLTVPALEGWIPETAVIAHLERESGGEVNGSGNWVSRVLLAMARDVSDRFSSGWNLGSEWRRGESRASIIYTLALGVDLFGKGGGFVEIFGTMMDGSGATVHFDAGLTLFVLPDLQLDTSAGFAMAGASPDGFLSVGLSWKFRI